MRRTSTMDAVRRHAPRPELRLIGHGRDLLSTATGATVLADADLDACIDLTEHPTVGSLSVSPGIAGVDTLVGAPASAGLRRTIAERTAAQPGTLEHLLLDEVPVCTLISFYSVMHARARETGINPVVLADEDRDAGTHGADGCAGFMSGGTIMAAIDAGARAVSTGPEAPSVLVPEDVLGWHTVPRDPPSDRLRRWRRTDVWADGGSWRIDSFYRDTHRTPDGRETVVHEYSITAGVEMATGIVTDCAAIPRVLPFVECLPAALSATRVTGARVSDLRRTVRQTLRGTDTCTHLNDQLRGLADLEYLSEGLRDWKRRAR